MAADLDVIRVRWDGIPTGPAVSTFYADKAGADPLPYLRSFYLAWQTFVPTFITWVFENAGISLDSSTGKPAATWSRSSVANVIGSSASGSHAAGGALVTWKTGVWGQHRQVIGRTYMVPLGVNAYQSDGTISDSVRGGVQTAADALRTGATGLRVYSRERKQSLPISSSTVVDKAVVLRSRRD